MVPVKKRFTTALLIISLALNACGGVIGNIEKYRFDNTSLQDLKSAVRRANQLHPSFMIFDSIKYQIGTNQLYDGDFYCRIQDEGTDYIFQYGYPQYPSDTGSIAEISLTSAAKYGENMNLASDISFLKKIRYRSIFKKYFITEVRKQLQK